MPLDDRRLLLNGLQPPRLSSGSAPLRPHKRQKTEGMNSRFDRMVQTVNVMYGSSRLPKRERAVSSSSITSYDIPTAPSDAYSDCLRIERKRGSVTANTRKSHPLPDPQDIFSLDAFSESTAPPGPPATELPSWLQGALSSLDSQHPLRLLVPEQAVTRGGSSPSSLGPCSDPLPAASVEECTFAFFSPPDPSDVATATRCKRATDVSQLLDKQSVGALVFQQDAPFSLLPFSEPGQLYTSVARDTFPSTSRLVSACPVSSARSPLDATRPTSYASGIHSPRSTNHGYSGEPSYTVHVDNIKFKWERFDRSNVAPQGSSSPLRAPPESEETFWSQPAMMAANVDGHTVAGQLVYASLVEMGGSRIPSPARNSDLARGLGGQPVTDLASSAIQSKHSQQDDQDSPFVWILPPRDQPVSTPRSKSKKPPASDCGSEVQSCGGVKEEGMSSARNPGNAPSAFARGSPFAPAPGVYISPLQDIQDMPRGDNDRPHLVSSEADNAVGSETPLFNIPTRHADPRIGKGDIVLDEDSISESLEKTPAPFPDVQDAMIDDIEDAGDCHESSQESRDTIESWTK
ncbi:hypothetical protein C8Q70DRAFT_932340 [Cubamyces menziesii]|nr:hypothetical protein C8Q70DRAFT_932340 [Cubamyces menziesii]